MTVKELIRVLRKEQQDAEIDITTYNDGYDSCLIIYDNEQDADNQTLIYL